MLSELSKKLASGDAVVGGVLSGTSADGIDVAIFRPAPVEKLGPPELLAFDTAPFPGELRASLRTILDGGPVALKTIASLHRDLGSAFGQAAADLARSAGTCLDLLGCAGQTVYHHDGNGPGRSTFQLGDGDFAAEAARCAVVSDFRQRDIAAGGEGAPLCGLVDAWIFAGLRLPTAVLNLGGMANLTVLEESKAPLAFDTGPAGSLLDGLARTLLGRECDEGGEVAARGRADPALCEELLRHPFFARSPPRSTGRDTFGASWVEGVVHAAAEHARRTGRAESVEDLLASATAFVAETVAESWRRFVPIRVEELLVCGGGVRNETLMRELSARLPLPVVDASLRGIDPKAREALVFGVLAVQCILGCPVTAPRATGARAGRILGKVSPPAPAWSTAVS